MQVPHLTDTIIEWIQRVAAVPVDDTNETPDVCIIELGGTGMLSRSVKQVNLLNILCQ